MVGVGGPESFSSHIDMAPDKGGSGGRNQAMAIIGTAIVIEALLVACASGQTLDQATATYNATQPQIVQTTPLVEHTDVDVTQMFTNTPRAEAPTPTATATVEATPWVNLPVQGDIVEMDNWLVPDVWEVGSSRRTDFFAVVEKEDGSKYVIWQPYEVDPNDYVSATMYWVQNGISLRRGEISIDGSAANGTREVLNRVYSEFSDIDGIILGDLDGARYNIGDYSNTRGFMMGRVSESLEPIMESVDNIGVIFLFNTDMKKGYVFNRNSSLPEGFLDDKGDWLYRVFPFATGSDNPLDIFNGYSKIDGSSGTFGVFELQGESIVFVPQSNGWNVENLLDLDNLGNEE